MRTVQLLPSKRHFTDGANKPLLWLADTGWNAPLKGTPEQWDRYLRTRQAQGFTAIQFVMMPWSGCARPVGGMPYSIDAENRITFHEEAWAYLDDWFAALRRHDLIPAPVIWWGLQPTSPGRALAEAHAITIGKRQVARYGGPDVVWFLGGDAEFRTPALAARWKRLGRGIFADHPEAIATMHTSGTSWAGDIFADEPWYRFIGYQSGHGYQGPDLHQLLNGPFSRRWPQLEMPFLNLEPNYEFARPFYIQRLFTRREVRRALWWSMLTVPTAGVSYGNNSIWSWELNERGEAEGHGNHWATTNWQNGLETDGIRDLMALREFFAALPWHELRPANEMLCEQPGDTDPNHTIRLSATPDNGVIVAYLPTSGYLTLADFEAADYTSITWWSPEHNETVEAKAVAHYHLEVPTFIPPSAECDWVWLARR